MLPVFAHHEPGHALLLGTALLLGLGFGFCLERAGFGSARRLVAVFYLYDSDELSPEARAILDENSTILKTYTTWTVTIEGHCDERGTADYNVVLGDKRAKVARTYLVESGVSTKQIGIVSYGKERPFCTDPNESCYQQNRRGHVLLKVQK